MGNKTLVVMLTDEMKMRSVGQTFKELPEGAGGLARLANKVIQNMGPKKAMFYTGYNRECRAVHVAYELFLLDYEWTDIDDAHPFLDLVDLGLGMDVGRE